MSKQGAILRGVILIVVAFSTALLQENTFRQWLVSINPLWLSIGSAGVAALIALRGWLDQSLSDAKATDENAPQTTTKSAMILPPAMPESEGEI